MQATSIHNFPKIYRKTRKWQKNDKNNYFEYILVTHNKTIHPEKSYATIVITSIFILIRFQQESLQIWKKCQHIQKQTIPTIFGRCYQLCPLKEQIEPVEQTQTLTKNIRAFGRKNVTCTLLTNLHTFNLQQKLSLIAKGKNEFCKLHILKSSQKIKKIT